ncbi:MAG: penicillin epimerase [Blastopirellula sp.]|nr:MAG: penicillin epimerase [Blastopirellula sp.]
MTNWSPHAKHWQLDPNITFLNHGCFGATPTVVLAAHRALVDQLEFEPVRYLAPERDLETKLDGVRKVIAELINAEPSNLAFVRNATDGINAVLRSFPLNAGDEIVVTNHGYNACNNAAKFAAQQSKAQVRVADVPFPLESEDQVLAAIEAQLTEKTRLLVVDHVTSTTGLIFPIQQIVEMAHQRNIRVLVDGAHAMGMLPLDLTQLGADYYTANHHKWLCGPKASGFLYVQPEHQAEVRPTVISHAANLERPGRSRFLAEFDWVGTYDATVLLAVPTAVDFLSRFKGSFSEHQEENHALALAARELLLDQLNLEPAAPASMIGSMVTFALSSNSKLKPVDNESLQARLFDHHQIEVPIFQGPDTATHCFRISAQAYNCIEQYEQLGNALREELR